MIAHKIIKASYYWPTIFNDAYLITRKFRPCQKFYGKMKRATMSLKPILMEEPFTQWGLDVIGPINPKSSKFLKTKR